MSIAVQNLLQASSIVLVAFFAGQLIPKSNAEYVQANVQPINYVSFEQVKDAMGGTAVIFDARAATAYEAGHIPGAINLPANSTDGEIKRALTKIKNGMLAITYCSDASCSDSHTLAIKLNQVGHENVAVYKEGWEEWQIVQPQN